ncbi:MAG: HEAT repeat domain-containing protein [Candidatus Binataceae bacterium]
MTFFCINCFAEIDAEAESCWRCGATQNLDAHDYATKVRMALAHPLADTRRRAIFLLGEKHLAEAVNQLIQLIDTEPDPFLVQEAVVALGKIGGVNALTALVRAVRHKSFLVRACAVEALIIAGGVWEKTAVKLALEDPSETVRETVRGGIDET